MRILFTRFPLESAYGGAEVQTLSLMKGLIARGHGVAFLGSCPTLLRLCEEQGILSGELTIGPPPVTKWSAMSFLWRKKAMRDRLVSAVQEFGALDAIVMLSLTEKLLLTPFALARGMRVLWVEHDRVGRWLTLSPWLPMLRRVSKGVTIVTVSNLSRKIYVEQLKFAPQNVVAVGNGIDPTRLEGGAALQRPSHSILHVGTVARLSSDKGIDVLLNAITALPGVTLDILPTGGNGSDAARIRSLTEKINRSGERVRILPPSSENIGAFYRSLDVFMLASREHDPCPLAPMEALWVGTPTILTDACGTAGYLKNGGEAIVVPAGSVTALQAALSEMQNVTKRQSFAKQGQQAAQERFSLDQMLDRYQALLTSHQASGT